MGCRQNVRRLSASFVEILLEEKGYPKDKISVGRKLLIYDSKKTIKVNIFNDDPLVIGEVTTYLGSEEASREIDKLLKRVRIAEDIYGRRALLRILSVANAPRDVLGKLREESEKHEITLMVGKELQ